MPIGIVYVGIATFSNRLLASYASIERVHHYQSRLLSYF